MARLQCGRSTVTPQFVGWYRRYGLAAVAMVVAHRGCTRFSGLKPLSRSPALPVQTLWTLNLNS